MIDMTSRTISITDNVYKMLSRLKLKNESFSETITRLAKKGKISECAGLWGDMPEKELEELEEGIKRMRESISLSIKRMGSR